MAEKASAVEKVIPEAEELPKAIVRRVVKEKLSQLSKDGADISVFKEALMAFSESARIFIHYLSAMANDICKESKRQTINAEDVFKALEEMEFPEFVGPLKASLEACSLSLLHRYLCTKTKMYILHERTWPLTWGSCLIAEFRKKNAGKRSASKAKEASRKKIKESAGENGGEAAQDDVQDEGDTNGNEDENDAPDNN